MVVVNNLNFNQDYSCIAVSTNEYYKIYNCDPFGEFYSSYGNGGENGGYMRRSNSSFSGVSTTTNANPNFSSESSQLVSSPTSFLKMLFSTSLTIIIPQNTASVGGDRLLKLYNLKQNLKICELSFPAHIVDVKLNRKRLCVILESGQIYIYDLSCVRLVKVLEIELPWHTPSAPNANTQSNEPNAGTRSKSGSVSGSRATGFVGDLSADDKSLLVIPLRMIKSETDLFNRDSEANSGGNDPHGSGSMHHSQPSTPHLAPIDDNLSRIIEFTHKSKNLNISPSTITVDELNRNSKGWILVYDTINLRPRLIYKAHDSSIAKIAISNDGSKIASASSKGTIIRTCSISTSVAEEDDDDEDDDMLDDSLKRIRISHFTNLRRGHNLTRVTCLAFSLDNNVLGCASESGTIHFFKLHDPDVLSDPSLEEDSSTENMMNRSSDDLNDNLASLLLSEEQQNQDSHSHHQQPSNQSYFHNLKNSMSLLNNTYTQSIVKKIPYKGYLENLWEPPRRSFAYVKIPEPEGSRIEIGFVNSMQVVLASYSTGEFYHYQLPSGEVEREEAILIGEFQLV